MINKKLQNHLFEYSGLIHSSILLGCMDSFFNSYYDNKGNNLTERQKIEELCELYNRIRDDIHSFTKDHSHITYDIMMKRRKEYLSIIRKEKLKSVLTK